MAPKGTIRTAEGKQPRHDGKVRADWYCRICTRPNGTPWLNKGSDMRCKGKCGMSKGFCHGENAKPASPATSKRQADRDAKLKAAQAEKGKAAQADKAKIKALEAEVKALKLRDQATSSASPTCEAHAAGTPASSEKSTSLEREISDAREYIKDLKGIPDRIKSSWMDYEAQVDAAKARLDEALAAKRAAHPIKQQYENAQAYQARAKKKWDDLLAKEAEMQQHVLDWQQRLTELRASTVEAKQAHAAAAEQTARLGALFASEVTEAAPFVGERLDSQEATLVRDLFRLVPEEKLNEACASSGIDAADVMARAMAVLSKIEAAEQPREPATVSALGAHRPAGTAAAADEVWGAHCDNIDGLAAAITVDPKDARMAQMQSEIEAHKAHMCELGQIWADMRNDLEIGTEPNAQSSAKRKKLGDFGSAISRLVAA